MGYLEVKSTDVEIVLDPPWSRDKMTDAAKLELGDFLNGAYGDKKKASSSSMIGKTNTIHP